jgi:hypothetical protein
MVLIDNDTAASAGSCLRILVKYFDRFPRINNNNNAAIDTAMQLIFYFKLGKNSRRYFIRQCGVGAVFVKTFHWLQQSKQN